jgi:hypothetical protein
MHNDLATLMGPARADHSIFARDLVRDLGTPGATKLSVGLHFAFHPDWLTEFK